MKSIKEWREENGMDEAFTRTALQNTLGDGAVDPAIKLKLRSKIMDLSKEFPDMSQAQLFQSIMAVVGQLLTHGSGSKVVAGGLYNKLNKAVPQGRPDVGQTQTNNSEEMK